MIHPPGQMCWSYPDTARLDRADRDHLIRCASNLNVLITASCRVDAMCARISVTSARANLTLSAGPELTSVSGV